MSDIRVELIRGLGPSRQRGEGALHTKPNRERQRGSNGPAPGAGRAQPAMGSAQRAAAGNKDPRTAALHRNALPRSRDGGGRAGRRARGREGTAVDRRCWHRAGCFAHCGMRCPNMHGTAAAGRHTPHRHAHPAPRHAEPAASCPLLQGRGGLPRPRLHPPSPPRDPAEHSRAGEGAGVSGWKAMGSQCCCADRVGSPHFCHGLRPSSTGTGHTSLQPVRQSLICQGCRRRHHSFGQVVL